MTLSFTDGEKPKYSMKETGRHTKILYRGDEPVDRLPTNPELIFWQLAEDWKEKSETLEAQVSGLVGALEDVRPWANNACSMINSGEIVRQCSDGSIIKFTESGWFFDIAGRVNDAISTLPTQYLEQRRKEQADLAASEERRKDCEVMAAWFKDLIEDEYIFAVEETPAFKAALKYIDPKELTLLVQAQPAVSTLTKEGG